MAGRLFSSFPEISPETLAILDTLGFKRATPVQEATLPLFAGNKDVAVDACTGSGKTLAFILPIIERFRRLDQPLKKHQVGAIIISPTRELARQIHSVALPFITSIPWMCLTNKEGGEDSTISTTKTSLLVGGTDPSLDVSSLRTNGANFLIGTPGRLHDIMQRASTLLDYKSLEVLVLDEADRLLDMGFKSQVDAIMARLPRQRRTGLFSATQTEAVEALARAGLRNPVRVAVAVALKHDNNYGTNGNNKYEQVTPSGLHIGYTFVSSDKKLIHLTEFIKAHADEKIIVYFLTCACVDFARLALPLAAQSVRGIAFQYNSGTTKDDSNSNDNKEKKSKAPPPPPSSSPPVPMWALHGKMKQGAREATLSSFATATHGVLLATDVAARGLDIPDVHLIVQADPPQDPAAFVHRVGRTARMGKSGRALALLLPHEEAYVEFLRLRKVPLIREDEEGKRGGNGTTDGTAHNDNDKGVEDGLELRKYTEKERELMEAGLKAFISYIRAYKEHHCSYIFRIQDLDIAALARSFGLLRLPRMPEIKKAHHQGSGGNGVDNVGFVASLIDPDTVPYKDKNRERQRVSGLAKKKAEREASIVASAVKKQAHQKAAAAPRLTAAKRRQLENRQELGEMNDDYALLKKLKKGKISEREFDVAAGLTDDDDDGGGGGDDDGGGGGGGEDGDVEEEGGSDGDEKRREASSLVAKAVMKKAKRKRRRNAKNNN